MPNNAYATLADAVAAQVALLREGKPLAAFDAFFGEAVTMYANDTLFATGTAQGRAKQEPFIAAATSIIGHITDVSVSAAENVCVFRNRSTFIDDDGVKRDIDGLSWQKWRDGRIVEERYYDGDLMTAQIAAGLLKNPALLLTRPT